MHVICDKCHEAVVTGLGMDLFPKRGIRVNTVAPGPVWCAPELQMLCSGSADFCLLAPWTCKSAFQAHAHGTSKRMCGWLVALPIHALGL